MLAPGSISARRTVEFILLDGTPNGVIMAQIDDWVGKVFSAPRQRLQDLIRKQEIDQSGVYILVGPDPDRSGGRAAYIGETDSIKNRMTRQLDVEEMDFFERAAFVVSTDDRLTKTHVRYLESQLIRLAKEAGRVRLTNGTDPDFARLPEVDRIKMGRFLEHALLVLPLLGFDLFRPIGAGTPGSSSASDESPIFELEAAGARATARETDDAFIVLAGATARKEGTPTFPESYRVLRDQLVKDGKLVDGSEPGLYRFAVDVPFLSPSAAASVVAARSASGPQDWKVHGTGQTYKTWRSARLAE